MMKKDFFDAVFSPGGTLVSGEFVGGQRERFFAAMESQYDLNPRMLYNRIFKIGFEAWMLMGVDSVKDEFARLYSILEDWREEREQSFMELIEEKDIPKMAFYKFIKELGISSTRVIYRRFTDEDWKDWERIGIKQILTEYCDSGY